MTVIDADLSTITTQADKLIRVDDPEPWLLHIDLQASWEALLDRRALKYNVLAHDRHDLPVHTTLVLLRREADNPSLTGHYSYRPHHRGSEVVFDYQVVRLWEQPMELFLTAGPGMLPLAPLCAVARQALPGVIRRMEERIRQDVTPAQAAMLWSATYILLGLRYPAEFASQLLQGVRAMKESTTYQAILAEGVVEGEKKLLLLMGSRRFGPPDEATRAAIESINSAGRLEQLSVRLLDVESWDELLASP